MPGTQIEVDALGCRPATAARMSSYITFVSGLTFLSDKVLVSGFTFPSFFPCLIAFGVFFVAILDSPFFKIALLSGLLPT